MQKLVFILVLFFIWIKPFAQNNPYQIIQNNEAKKNRKTNQVQSHTSFKKDTLSKPVKSTLIQISAGGLYTSLNFFKNAQQFTYYPAYSIRLYYQPKNGFIQFVVDYSKVQQVNIVPTWLNVQNTFIDLDAHFLMHPDNAGRTLVYFILGVSSQQWKSFYTGIDDYNSAVLKIKPNTNYKAVYYGGSIGIGFEFKLVKRVTLYGEVRYRITKTDVGFGLSDVCYGAGLKYTLLDIHPKSIYGSPHKHFKWVKAKSENNF